MTTLLAIDDDPTRYTHLQALLEERVARGASPIRLVVAGCRKCIMEHLPTADAVFLDYDLDSENLCATCGDWPPQVKSTCYIDHVVFHGRPVIVVSESLIENIDRLCAILEVKDDVRPDGWATPGADVAGAPMGVGRPLKEETRWALDSDVVVAAG